MYRDPEDGHALVDLDVTRLTGGRHEFGDDNRGARRQDVEARAVGQWHGALGPADRGVVEGNQPAADLQDLGHRDGRGHHRLEDRGLLGLDALRELPVVQGRHRHGRSQLLVGVPLRAAECIVID
mgnify:CR=1 FL=1